MGENEYPFVPPGVDPGAGRKAQINGEKAREAAIGSGQRAEEAREKAAEELRKKAEEAARKAAQDPRELKKAREAIEQYRMVARNK